MSSSVPAPSADPRAWVVIPLYNEATVIGGVIESLKPHFAHIVCVDDGSSDGSAAEAAAAGAHLVQHPVNLGQGRLSRRASTSLWRTPSATTS